MKKLLFLLIPACFFAQTNFKKLDSLQFRQNVDQLVKDTGRNYILVTDRNDDDSDNFMYVNSEDKTDILLIKYRDYMEGKNVDLQLPGVKRWNIIDIYGKYLALFPIWKKYYQKDADKEVISKNSMAPMKGFPEYSFRRFEGEIWNIGL
ncbi:hypothetical protein V2E39_16940 [Chryseobacterium arthrosphaerae]|uniref:Uncharacterized protein n=1 Tax=Chryseobacterium arthrosphaerae TaxID=651561 RepID=A0ABU7R2V7_9FLAO